jgi:hypothetical protein
MSSSPLLSGAAASGEAVVLLAESDEDLEPELPELQAMMPAEQHKNARITFFIII